MSTEDEIEDNSACVDEYGAPVDWDTRFGIGPAPGINPETDSRNPMTDKQKEIVSFVHGAALATGSPPSIREISDYVGKRQPAGILGHLRAIKKKGYIDNRPYISRSWRVIPIEEHASKHAP